MTSDSSSIHDAVKAAVEETLGRDGSIRHFEAAENLRERLVGLESDGLAAAGQILDQATRDGLVARVKRHAKSLRVPVRLPSGRAVRMPKAYSQRRAGGGVQLAMWMYLSLEDLDVLIADLSSQRGVLAERVEVLRYARRLMVKHDTTTAEQAFRVEGLDPTSIEFGAA